MTELCFQSASELSQSIRTKRVSPVELTRALLDRIAGLNPVVNAYLTLLPDAALQQAAQAESEIMKDLYRGPLHGIPIGVKDNYLTRGVRTTGGSRVYASYIPDKDADAVDHLRQAGAIMLGKLNMHELGGGLTNTNLFYGHARNPWHIGCSPGGSSGGSGAALAGGLAVLATGTDTFGSIRVPASMCGVYGLKPSYGLVSTNGVIPLAPSMDHAGPMARSARDLALMLHAMSRNSANSRSGSVLPAAKVPDGIRGCRIGIPTTFLSGLEPAVEHAFQQAAAMLETMGAYVQLIDIPEFSDASAAAFTIVTAEAAASNREILIRMPEALDEDVRIFMLQGLYISPRLYEEAQQARMRIFEAFKRVMQSFDLLAGPSIPITAPLFRPDWVRQNLEIDQRCMPFVAPASLTGCPCLSVPIGCSPANLPIGMQLLGQSGSESMLLQAGIAWEDAKKPR